MQVVSLFQKDGFFGQFNALGDDAFLGKPKPVDDPDKGIHDTVFPIVVGVACRPIFYMLIASPHHAAVYNSSSIKSTALRTLNAVRKRIFCGSHFRSGVQLTAFFQKFLHGGKDFFIYDSLVCAGCVILFFLTVIDVLSEWDCCFAVFFLIQTVADVFLVRQHF